MTVPILRDPTGKVVPLGRVIRTRTADFSDGVLPSWLRTTAVGLGTATFGDMATTPGYVQLNTGAVNLDSLSLETTFQVSLNQFDEMILTVEGLYCDAATAFNVAIGFTNYVGSGGQGAEFRHVSSDTKAILRTYRAAGVTDQVVRYVLMTGGFYAHRRNLTFRLRPKKNRAYLEEDDQQIGWMDTTGTMDLAAVRPRVYIITRHSAAHWIRLSQLKLTLIHN